MTDWVIYKGELVRLPSLEAGKYGHADRLVRRHHTTARLVASTSGEFVSTAVAPVTSCSKTPNPS